MEEALRALLLADTAIAARVGTRVDWNLRVQGGELDAITLTEVGGEPDVTHGGVSGLRVSRVQIDCWSATAKGAKLTARAVEAALTGRRRTQGSVSFRGFFLNASRGSVDTALADPVHRCSLDYTLWSGAA